MARALSIIILSLIPALSSAGKLADEVIRHGASFRGLAPLVELERRAALVPRPQLKDAVQRMLRSPRLHPLLRHEVAMLQARLLLDEGRVDESSDTLRADGVLATGWWIDRPTGYHDVTLAWPLGEIPLDSLGGADGALVRLRRWVNARGPVAVSVRTTWPEPVAVAINGAEGATARLRPGWNRVTLTTRAVPGAGLTVRLEHPDGRPYAEPSGGSPPAPGEAAPAPRPAGHRPLAGLVERWEQTDDPALAADRLRVLGWAGREAEPVPRGADLDTRVVFARLTDRSEVALRLLDAALHEDPDHVEARLERARRRHARGQSLTALDDARAAAAAAPGTVEPALLEAEILGDLQLLGEAQGRLSALRRSHPDVPAVPRALASVLQRRQLPEAALEAYRIVAATDGAGGEALYQVCELEKGLGHGAPALDAARELIRRRPDVPGHRLQLVRLLADLGDFAGADEVAGAATTLFDRDPDLLSSVGDFYLDRGDTGRGLALLRRSLQLRPHQPDVRERLAWYDRERGGFMSAYAVDVRDVITEAPRPDPGAPDAEYLLSQRVTRLFDDGTTTTWTQHILRVNRVRGQHQTREWTVTYDPSRQGITVLAARRYSAAGAVVTDAEISDAAVGESWYGLYYEQRATGIRFTDVSEGDVLVVEHRLSDFGRNLYGGTYGDLAPLQAEEPVRRVRAVWVVPPSRSFQARQFGGGSPPTDSPPTDEVRGNLRHVVFDERDLPAIEVEPRMPGYTEVGRYVHASTFGDFGEVAAWYRDLVSDQLTPGPAVRREAQALVADGQPLAERARALHEFVTRRIRYVGLEFGEHGYKPYRVDDIYDRRFGDCKDKASLLKAMLALSGGESHLVLVRTRRGGRIPEAAASPAVFDHALLYVPELDLYVDPTAPWHGPGELPEQDQGASALIVTDRGSRFVTLPVMTAEQSVLERKLALRVASDGSLTIEGELAGHGALAPPLRERFSVPAQRTDELARMLNGEFPGAHVAGAEFDVDALVGAAWLRYRAEAPGHEQAVALLPASLSLQRSLAPAEERRHDLVLAHPFTWRWDVTVTLADGMTLGDPAVTRRERSRFGQVDAAIERLDPRRARVSLTVRVDAHRVSVADYPAFRDFLGRADRAIGAVSRLELSR